MEELKKRCRPTTFTAGEIAQLISIVAKHKDVVESKKLDLLTNKEKEIAWDKITTAFNAVVPSGRTAYTLKTKYEAVKKAAKKKAALYRHEMCKTGILQKSSIDFTPAEIQVLAMCNFPGFDNRYDSDEVGDIPGDHAELLLSDCMDYLELEPPDDTDSYVAPNTTPRNEKKTEAEVLQELQQLGISDHAEKTIAVVTHTVSPAKYANTTHHHSNPPTPRAIKNIRPNCPKATNTLKIIAEKPKAEKLIEAKLELLELQKVNAKREMDYRRLEFEQRKEEHELRMAHAENEGLLKHQSSLSNLVYFNKAKRISYCLLCWRRFTGLSQSNIKRHYMKQHGYSFEEEANAAPGAVESRSKVRSSNRSHIHVRITKSKFLTCCMGLVAMHNIPLEVFNDNEYFKQLIDPYEQAFGTDLSAGAMSEQIAACAGNIKEQLRKTFNTHPMSLKADIATMQTGENKLLLTVHYLKEFVAQAHTIGVISLPADQLRAQITNCLADFGIDMSQIYCFVTDYGPSKWVHDKENIDSEYETIHSLLAADFGAIRCTRQVFNMAAYDTIKDFHTPLTGCRTAVENLQKYIRSECTAGSELTPPIVKDNGNYWLSTYRMIESLLNARSYINLNNIEKCFNAPWLFAEKFVETFRTMVECLNKIQPNEYVVGDFYRDWLLCEAKLEKIQNNRVAENLLSSMLKYKEGFLCDEAFNIAALYFDPRFNYQDSPFWSEEKKRISVQHLLKTSTQINSSDPEFPVDLEQNVVNENNSAASAALEDPFEDLEIKVRAISNNNSFADTTLGNQNISHLIDRLVNVQRLPFGTNLLEYWKMSLMKEKPLIDLAQVVLAVPTNQASAEPAFSALSAILSNQPADLAPKTVQDMLMIKLNHKLLDG